MEERNKLEKLVSSTYHALVEECFHGWHSYCYQTGSFTYGGGTLGKSDLDITIVFQNSIYDLPKDELLKRIKIFIGGYLDLHIITGYVPDVAFPGEYVTEIMVADAVAGRGFHADEEERLYLPKASLEYYLANPERWFRAWLSQSAFCTFLSGDRHVFEENKISGWASILKFVLKDVEQEQVSVLGLMTLLRPFGVHPDYWSFVPIESPWVLRALHRLAKLEFIDFTDAEKVIPNKRKLLDWEKGLASSITSGVIRKSELILSLEETLSLSRYARNLLEQKTKNYPTSGSGPRDANVSSAD